MHSLLRALIVTVSLASPAWAGVVVPLGSRGRDVVADPARPLFYVALSTNEIAVVDALSPAILGRIGLPAAPGNMVILADRDLLYVTLGMDVGVVDLGTWAVGPLIDLSTPLGPYDLALGRPGRLLALSVGTVHFIDTAAGVEVSASSIVAAAGRSTSRMATSADGGLLYVMDLGLSPVSAYAFDVTTDQPCYVGEDVCHGCLGGNGRDLGVSPDGRVHVASGSPYVVQVLASNDVLGPVSSLLTGPYPNALAFSPGTGETHAGAHGRDILTSDTQTSCPLRVVVLSGSVVDSGLAATPDGSVIAALVEDGSFQPTLLEVTDVSALPRNLGGVRVRGLDAATGRGLDVRLQTEPWSATVQDGLVDTAQGLAGLGPLPEGPVMVTVSRSGYATQMLSTVVVGGRWTDLGNVALTRTGTPAGIVEPYVPVGVLPGDTADVEVHGLGFEDGVIVTAGADVTVNSWAFVDWNRLSVNLTVAASATPGKRSFMLWARNPGAATSKDVSGVVADACLPTGDIVPPEEVRLLMVNKAPAAVDPYLFSWQPVLLDVNGAPEVLGWYEISRATVPTPVLSAWVVEPTTQYPWTPPADDDLDWLQFYLVRARDAAGNLGE